MGIKSLFKIIKEKAPGSFREISLSVYSSKTIALDASKTIYQFMVSTTNYSANQNAILTLTDSEGNPTGFLMGFIYKSLLFLELGLKPIWVFDGIPPEQKRNELRKRKEKKLEAKIKQDEAKDLDNAEDQLKFAQRNIRVTPQMNEDAMTLLRYMGIPVFKSQGEAEAECVNMLKSGVVDCVGSDDMDCLTFGCKVLIKGIRTKKDPVIEISLEKVLKEFGFSMEQFIDFCILSGCDYLGTIPKIGPSTAFKLLQDHKNMEGVLAHLKEVNEDEKDEDGKVKYMIPDNYDFETARDLFKNPDVNHDYPKFTQETPNIDLLTKFLVEQKQFDENRVNGVITKLIKSKNSKPQMSLETFFGRPQSSKKKPLPQQEAKKKRKKINFD